MFAKKVLTLVAVVLLTAVTFISLTYAAEEENQSQSRQPQRQARDDRGGRGRFDPEAMQKRMSEMMKERLEISDDEWKVVEPRLSKVMNLSRNARFGGMNMFARDGRFAGSRSQREQTAVEKAQQDLRELLDKDKVSPEMIKAGLTALREAREKAKQELITAQQELREVLTLKQEAQLVLMGTLE
ncbi:hypothetical protein SMSP2_01764 [Limihaloglobus sulfuriphilus]|uniref:Periplasmic heavy metal sensor n=1 Tax=Limihaloglobus sulfuriphilus TaxID=1851148 RepID=A0A1Q2MFB6_9BACT|nr:hypothetical protein [Limihaloglobus sulfuriphilus]AQQ71391.1 hypothetical protein SMSP2_01764 [Limihaloglobus sulfuriphilus]